MSSRHANDAALDCKQKEIKISSMLGCPENENVERLFNMPLVAKENHSSAFSEGILRDGYQNLWPVKLTKVGDDWFFEDGWIHTSMMIQWNWGKSSCLIMTATICKTDWAVGMREDDNDSSGDDTSMPMEDEEDGTRDDDKAKQVQVANGGG
ncbi:hypothetical protein Adt_41024 [Abeliophyllum distichum]|uniref:Uncharacterized protein n=1 Tax=Abeliophyllum distichum TaxID=126358 RepID=A0ABD1PP74_9LAMI